MGLPRRGDDSIAGSPRRLTETMKKNPASRIGSAPLAAELNTVSGVGKAVGWEDGDAASPHAAAVVEGESASTPTPAPRQRPAPAKPPTVPSRELDVFPNPAPERDYLIQFLIPEFTCNCPLTGQPDFAQFTIEMICDRLCIELKSLKLYFWSYRDTGAFHEKVTNTIVDDIVRAVDPRFIRITAKWNVRGGIYTQIVAEHRQPGWTPPPRVDLAPAPALGLASFAA